MECPNVWFECDLCKHKKECDDGEYKGELTDVEVVVKAAEISKKVVNTEVRKNVESIRGTSWAEKFLTEMSEEERWRELRKYPIPNLHSVADPYKAEQGAIVPGGSKTGKVKKSNKGTKVFQEPWTSNV